MLVRLRGHKRRDQAILVASLLAAYARWIKSGLLRQPFDRFPRTVADAVLVSRLDGTRFVVRGGSDDLYSILPGRERDVAHKILAPLRPGDTFVDLGANVGGYALVAASRVGVHGRVVAVEADPDTAAVLQRAVRMNGLDNVRIVECAVSDRTGDLVEFEVPARHRGQARSVTAGGPLRGSPTIPVPTATLDSICEDVKAIRVLKLDVEGSEPAALRGGQATLRKTETAVVETAYQADLIQQLLTAADFDVVPLKFARHVWARRVPTPDSDPSRQHHPGSTGQDLDVEHR